MVYITYWKLHCRLHNTLDIISWLLDWIIARISQSEHPGIYIK